MIRRSFIGLANVLVLVGVTACVDDPNRTLDLDAGNQGEVDGSETTGNGPDGGDTGESADGGSSGTGEDAASSNGSLDSGDEDAGGTTGEDAAATDAGEEIDAATDAGEEIDAATDAGEEIDAATDAGEEIDAATDAGEEIDAATDAEPDAMEDAGEDPVLPELAAHYSFDENTGTAAADVAGSFADAMLMQDASWTPGVTGSAVQLAGDPSGNHVELPADILSDCDDVTVALWMKLGSSVPWARLLEIDGLTNGFLFFTPTQDVAGAPHLHFNIVHFPGPVDHGVSEPYPAGTSLVDEWHHVAFTLSEGTGRLYFDGVELGSNAMGVTTSDIGIAETAPPAQLGRSIVFPTDAHLNGAIDDFMVSCTAFTAEQVAQLAQLPE